MAETDTTATNEAAKSHFTKAMDEAKAGAQIIADGYREKFKQSKDEFKDEAKTRSADAQTKAEGYAAEAKEKAAKLANDGKARTSQAMFGLSKVIDDNTALIDEKVGPKYGDYVRTASKSVKDAAGKLDEKSLDELGVEAREFVRTSPGLAIGMAVAAGYMIGRILKRG